MEVYVLLRLNWVTGQVPRENFWILHKRYWLWIYWIGWKLWCVLRDIVCFEKDGKEEDEYISKFSCSLVCHVILRISVWAVNFCLLLNCLKYGSRDNNKHLPSSISVPFIFPITKSAAVSPHRKFWFVSYVEHFEAVPFLLLANCLLPLHPHFFEYLNYFVLCGLRGEVEGITVGQSRDIYAFFSFHLEMSHSSAHPTPSRNRNQDFSTSPEFAFLKQMEEFLLSTVFSLIPSS